MYLYETSDHLAHYGVLGMRWGVRRYEDKNGRLTAAGKERYDDYEYDRDSKSSSSKSSSSKSSSSKSSSTKKSDVTADKERSKSTKSSDYKSEEKKQNKTSNKSSKKQEQNSDGLSTKQKIALAAVAAVSLRATAKFVDAGAARRLIVKGRAALGKGTTAFKRNENLARANMSTSELHENVVKRINPDYGKPGTKMNCRRCTFAYEMSRRGYDVKATRSRWGSGQAANGLHNATSSGRKIGKTEYVVDAVKRGVNEDNKKHGDPITFKKTIDTKVLGGMGFKNVEADPFSNTFSKPIYEALSEYPNGARGELCVMWNAGGAHSIAWEIVDGKPIIFDCQTGEKYETIAEFTKGVGQHVKMASVSRLDDIELDEDFLLRWLQNA